MKKNLTHAEEIKEIINYTSELSANKTKSDDFLIRSGIQTNSGQLTQPFKNLVKDTVKDTMYVCEPK